MDGGTCIGSARLQLLAWDSEFFGVATGRIDLLDATADEVGDAERAARRIGLACLYGELDPADAVRIDLVQRLGYRLMEVAVELDHPTSVLVEPPPTSASVRQGTVHDLPALEAQIAAVAPWSRYAVDPRFGLGPAAALHRAWVVRAARGDDDRMLLVAEVDATIVAMATLRDGEESVGRRPRIDLIASTERGSGAAQALVGHAFGGFGPGPSDGGPIAARNVVSLRFSEQMGYRMAGVRYLFHRWLDEAVAPEMMAATNVAAGW